MRVVGELRPGRAESGPVTCRASTGDSWAGFGRLLRLLSGLSLSLCVCVPRRPTELSTTKRLSHRSLHLKRYATEQVHSLSPVRISAPPLPLHRFASLVQKMNPSAPPLPLHRFASLLQKMNPSKAMRVSTCCVLLYLCTMEPWESLIWPWGWA